VPLLTRHLSLCARPLAAAELSPAPLLSAGDGAIASFIGVVRDHHGGRGVRSLRYECYQRMAEAVLARIAGEVAAALDAGSLPGLDEAPGPAGAPLRLHIHHAYGELLPGQASLAVHAASPHRVAAFAACREVVEAIKRDLPIWKEERYDDGTARWLRGS
jgi:molybdopterin synthase catalytic subunit